MGAERKPDFSGEHALNPQASVLAGGAATVRSRACASSIASRWCAVRVSSPSRGTNFNYTLERVSDGRDVCLVFERR